MLYEEKETTAPAKQLPKRKAKNPSHGERRAKKPRNNARPTSIDPGTTAGPVETDELIDIPVTPKNRRTSLLSMDESKESQSPRTLSEGSQSLRARASNQLNGPLSPLTPLPARYLGSPSQKQLPARDESPSPESTQIRSSGGKEKAIEDLVDGEPSLPQTIDFTVPNEPRSSTDPTIVDIPAVDVHAGPGLAPSSLKESPDTSVQQLSSSLLVGADGGDTDVAMDAPAHCFHSTISSQAVDECGPPDGLLPTPDGQDAIDMSDSDDEPLMLRVKRKTAQHFGSSSTSPLDNSPPIVPQAAVKGPKVKIGLQGTKNKKKKEPLAGGTKKKGKSKKTAGNLVLEPVDLPRAEETPNDPPPGPTEESRTDLPLKSQLALPEEESRLYQTCGVSVERRLELSSSKPQAVSAPVARGTLGGGVEGQAPKLRRGRPPKTLQGQSQLAAAGNAKKKGPRCKQTAADQPLPTGAPTPTTVLSDDAPLFSDSKVKAEDPPDTDIQCDAPPATSNANGENGAASSLGYRVIAASHVSLYSFTTDRETLKRSHSRSSSPPPLLDVNATLEESLSVPTTEDTKLFPVQYDTISAPALLYRPKPPLKDRPPIWAVSRQEVCESLAHFRSYQSGVYHSGGVAHGYLLSGFPAKRDAFEHDGRLIISHGGGKAESIHCSKGQHTTHSASDQLATDKSVRALIQTYKEGRRIALLIDDKYVPFPFDIGAIDVTYAVLGFYTIVDCWAEYENANNISGRVVRWKFAFQWCDDQGKPWWLRSDEVAATNTVEATDTGDDLPAAKPTAAPESVPNGSLYKDCDVCQDRSPHIFEHGWACLQPSCRKFWRDSSGRFFPEHLSYASSFLALRPSPPIMKSTVALIPKALPASPLHGISTSYEYSRGWHCGGCGRLSCRFRWDAWQCLNCGRETKIQGIIRKAKDLRDLNDDSKYLEDLDYELAKSSKIVLAGSTPFKHAKGWGRCLTFDLPFGGGKIHLLQPGTRLALSEVDQIFEKYQEEAQDERLKFRRWPLRAHKLRGEMLSHYYSQNTGEPYQYVGGAANTVPMSEAPDAVRKAREYIQMRISQALERKEEFNEVLSAAYLERQRMAFHSDNEVGLGPVVAGLSLGAPALMHFRVHGKYEKSQRRIAATFLLRHGDVLVMDGAGVQEYYEHTVVPTNFRIAATARQIGV